MDRSRWSWCALVGAAVLAVAMGGALRVGGLADRPMHHDEANNTIKFSQLWIEGAYAYDPVEYHGPTLYYATLITVLLSGADDFASTTEPMYRLVPAMFGIALILLPLLVYRALGPAAAVGAMLLTALSPAMVFYSRDYIHETLLVFFAFAAMAAGLRYVHSRRVGWAVVAGVCRALMYATKETAVLFWFAMAVAAVDTLFWKRPGTQAAASWNYRHVAIAGGAALLVWLVMFSAFFTHWRGPVDALAALGGYLQRGAGHTEHLHPWYYYLKLLAFTKHAPGPWWSEGLILLLAAIGVVAALSGKGLVAEARGFARFVAIYTLVLTLVFSALPYKTPWNMLGFLQGMILLAAIGAVVLVRMVPTIALRAVVSVVLLAATCHLGVQAYRGAYTIYAADWRNPYTYSDTLGQIHRLRDRVMDIAAVHHDGTAMRINVIATDGDYWPLPWYLRQFDSVGYYDDPAAVGGGLETPLIITSADLELPLSKDYQTEHVGLRRGVVLRVYIERELWAKYMQTRSGP